MKRDGVVGSLRWNRSELNGLELTEMYLVTAVSSFFQRCDVVIASGSRAGKKARWPFVWVSSDEVICA